MQKKFCYVLFLAAAGIMASTIAVRLRPVEPLKVADWREEYVSAYFLRIQPVASQAAKAEMTPNHKSLRYVSGHGLYELSQNGNLNEPWNCKPLQIWKTARVVKPGFRFGYSDAAHSHRFEIVSITSQNIVLRYHYDNIEPNKEFHELRLNWK